MLAPRLEADTTRPATAPPVRRRPSPTTPPASARRADSTSPFDRADESAGSRISTISIQATTPTREHGRHAGPWGASFDGTEPNGKTPVKGLTFERCGHYVPEEKPKRLLEELEKFLED